MRYSSNKEIIGLVKAFEDAKVSRDKWKHAEHLVVALHYVNVHTLGDAIERMRERLLNLLTNGFEVDLTKEMPYHETLTVFWMQTVERFSREHPELSLVEKANSLIEKFDKDYPLRFYSRDRLFSEEARAKFIEHDLRFEREYQTGRI